MTNSSETFLNIPSTFDIVDKGKPKVRHFTFNNTTNTYEVRKGEETRSKEIGIIVFMDPTTEEGGVTLLKSFEMSNSNDLQIVQKDGDTIVNHVYSYSNITNPDDLWVCDTSIPGGPSYKVRLTPHEGDVAMAMSRRMLVSQLLAPIPIPPTPERGLYIHHKVENISQETARARIMRALV